MKTKYQLDNPNNCRIKIDFNNPENPAKFEYIGDNSAFQVCYRLFRQKVMIYYGLAGIMLTGYMIGEANNNNIILFIALFFNIIGIFFLFPFLLALLFSKTKLIRLVPYIWASGKTKFYVQFAPEDIKDNKVEIPLFANQFLNYKLSGDFINKINTIDIVEHPFNILVLKGRNRKELKPNEYLWKAVFTFKEKPKDGMLIVIFC